MIYFKFHKRIIETLVIVIAIIISFQISPFENNVKADSFIPTDISFNKALGIFELGDSVTAQLNFNQANITSNQITYSLTDYYGVIVKTGTLSVAINSNNVQIPLGNLGNGHYTLQTTLVGYSTSVNSYFTVVPNSSSRIITEDSPFAMDAALTIINFKLANWTNALALDYARAIKLLGVKTVRERHRWNDYTNPSQGVFNFDYYNFNPYFNALKSYGVDIMPAYNSGPTWAKRSGSTYITGNLKSAYDFAKNIADYYGDTVGAWEMFNEPELATSNNESPDRMAAYVKAVAIGLNDSAFKPLVSAPSVAYPPAFYADTLMQNQLGKFIDVYNFHAHRQMDSTKNIMSLPPAVAQNIDYLSKYNLKDKRAWLSEAGVYMPIDTGVTELSYDKQKKQARYIITSSVQSLATGVDKHFFFVLPYYVENNTQMGIMTQDNKPCIGYTAESVLTYALGKGEYSGSVKGLPIGAEGYAFKNDSNTILVLWSENSQNFILQAPTSNQTSINITDIIGNTRTITPVNGKYTLNIGADPIYVKINGLPSADLINAKTYDAKVVGKPVFTPAQRVVIEQIYPSQVSADSKSIGYQLPSTGSTSISVEVNNLNNTTMAGTIKGTVFGGLSLSTGSQSISLAPFEKKILIFSLSSTANIKYNVTIPVVFSGTFGGEKTTDSVSNVVVANDTIVSIAKKIPNYSSTGSWTVNAALGVTTNITYPTSDSVRFVYAFPAGSTWTYPKLNITPSVDFSGSRGLVLNINSAITIPSTSTFRVIITENNGSSYMNLSNIQVYAGTGQIRIPWERFSPSGMGVSDDNFHLDLDQFKMIQVGFNSTVISTADITMNGFGVYNENDSGIYTNLTNITPSNQSTINSNSVTAFATVTAGEIDLVASTIRAEIDGKSLFTSFNSTTRQISAPIKGVEKGTHTVDFYYFDASNRAVKGSTTFTLSQDIPPNIFAQPIKFVDQTNMQMSVIGNSSYIKAISKLDNIATTDSSVQLVVALYDENNRLKMVITNEQNIVAGAVNMEIFAELSNLPTGIKKIKAFIWDGFFDIMPYIQSTEISR